MTMAQHIPVQLVREPVFSIQVGTTTFSGLRQIGQPWNGLLHLHSADHGDAVVTRQSEPMSRCLEDAFDTPADPYVLVKASGQILAAARAAGLKA